MNAAHSATTCDFIVIANLRSRARAGIIADKCRQRTRPYSSLFAFRYRLEIAI